MNKIILNSTNGKKILFAAVPADGHFNPMIRLAKHMQKAGYDVRWYAATKYEDKLNKLKIPMFRFRKDLDTTIGEAETIFPERTKIKSALGRLRFDLEEFFIKRGPVYFEDIREIYKTFPFDLFVSDIAFTGSIFVKQILKIPVIAIGVLPLIETSKDLAPSGLGMKPPAGWFDRLYHSVLRMAVKNIMLRKPNKLSHRLLAEKGIDQQNTFLFDLIIQKSDYVLQSGTPGFEYKRSDLSNNIKFIGPLVYHGMSKRNNSWFDNRLLNSEIIVLITQGPIEKDPNKLLIPGLEALKDTGALIIVTTGGSHTNELKSRYSQPNIIIEDYIDFNDVMPYADVYITNGGYGGVMMAIENRVPMVVAGVHEGKNEICTRVGYFKCGIDLKTERPDKKMLRSAVFGVLGDPIYKRNIDDLHNEFKNYNPDELFENYVAELTEMVQGEKTDTRRAA
ncbi:MAG TPA: nucleotide disphospho-sugar-binding domain-containing protein [Puia sp.]|nr:nucleotide disphospho-sugar-binding domain-containing protein [Puia sp.]